jgi:hypothetical protein
MSLTLTPLGLQEVGKKRKHKNTQKIEGETHWQELITEATHQMQHNDNLSERIDQDQGTRGGTA